VRTVVTEDADLEAAVEAASAAELGLRVAVACAGVVTVTKTLGRDGAHPGKLFQRILDLKLLGTFNLLRLAAEAMTRNEPQEGGARGVVVMTSSVAAFDGQIGQVACAATKGGIAMTLPDARDLARHGICVLTIAPSTFDSPLTAELSDAARAGLAESVPFPHRLGDPAEFAALVSHDCPEPDAQGRDDPDRRRAPVAGPLRSR
jgi:NAD(P)-dependent dehydrogenase (short-subunit alcohol dehydrogenase family)